MQDAAAAGHLIALVQPRQIRHRLPGELDRLSLLEHFGQLVRLLARHRVLNELGLDGSGPERDLQQRIRAV